MIFEKIKRIITGKKDQNVKSDALLEEEKNELIIERYVENHNDVINWSKEDHQRLRILVNPECVNAASEGSIPYFCSSYLSVYFDYNNEKGNYITKNIVFGNKKRTKIPENSTLLSIKNENTKDEIKLLNKAKEKILERFVNSTKPGTKVIIKYRKTKSKTIEKLSIKTGSFDDLCKNFKI